MPASFSILAYVASTIGLAALSACSNETTSAPCGPGTIQTADGCRPKPRAPGFTCGAGTAEDGGLCVAAAYGTGGAPTVNGGAGGAAIITDAGNEGFISAGGADSGSIEPSDATPPEFLGATEAKPYSASSVLVTWKPASDDRTPQDRIVYEIFWSTAPGGQDFSNPAVVTAPGATEAVAGGLVGEPEEYRFVVRARDEAGNRDDNTVEVTSDAGFDRTPPVFAGCKSASVSGTTGILVEWDAASDSVTPAPELVYRVWLGSTEPAALDHSRPPDQTVTGSTAALFETLFRGTTYYFSCEVTDAAGNRDRNAVTKMAVIDAPPSMPVCEPVFRSIRAKQVDVEWCPGWDDVTPAGDLTYVITATVYGVGTETVFESGAGADTATLTGLSPNTGYVVEVRARDGNGGLSEPRRAAYFMTPPTFSGGIQPLFDSQCVSSGCHDSTTRAAALDLMAGSSYANLMLPATQGDEIGQPGILRVKPGKETESYLLWKLCGYFANPPARELMPPPTGSGYETCNMVAAWIGSGAPND